MLLQQSHKQRKKSESEKCQRALPILQSPLFDTHCFWKCGAGTVMEIMCSPLCSTGQWGQSLDHKECVSTFTPTDKVLFASKKSSGFQPICPILREAAGRGNLLRLEASSSKTELHMLYKGQEKIWEFRGENNIKVKCPSKCETSNAYMTQLKSLVDLSWGVRAPVKTI